MSEWHDLSEAARRLRNLAADLVEPLPQLERHDDPAAIWRGDAADRYFEQPWDAGRRLELLADDVVGYAAALAREATVRAPQPHRRENEITRRGGYLP